MTITNGIFINLSNEEYHGNKNYISRSGVVDYMRSPYTYWAKHLNPDRPTKEATRQMELGSAFHTIILEPALFHDNYLIIPEKVLLKHVGKEAYGIYKAKIAELKHTSKIVLTEKERQVLAEMEINFFLNAHALELIAKARIENSFFWQDKESGLLLKARPDVLQSNIIIDLKTCSDASERAMQYEIFKYGYDIQMAMIRDAVENVEGNRIENFILICIETKYPFNMGLYILDEEIVDNAQRKYKSVLMNMKESIEKNEWNDYGINRILLPKWEVYA